MTVVDPPCVSGALACNLRATVAELLGEPLIARALLRVPDEARVSYVTATAVGWIPIATMETVFAEIAGQAGRTIADLHTEVARISIERTMRGVWRVLLRVTTDRALMSRTPVIFGKSYNRGRLESNIPVPGRAEVALLDWPDVPDWPLRATRIGIGTVLAIAGRCEVRVDCTRNEQGAFYLATWS